MSKKKDLLATERMEMIQALAKAVIGSFKYLPLAKKFFEANRVFKIDYSRSGMTFKDEQKLKSQLVSSKQLTPGTDYFWIQLEESLISIIDEGATQKRFLAKTSLFHNHLDIQVGEKLILHRDADNATNMSTFEYTKIIIKFSADRIPNIIDMTKPPRKKK